MDNFVLNSNVLQRHEIILVAFYDSQNFIRGTEKLFSGLRSKIKIYNTPKLEQ